MKPLLFLISVFLLSSYSYSQEVFTGPFLIRDGIYYHQDTNKFVTGIIETFNENGQLEVRGNYRDGKREGLWEYFDENGNLTKAETFRNGVLQKK